MWRYDLTAGSLFLILMALLVYFICATFAAFIKWDYQMVKISKWSEEGRLLVVATYICALVLFFTILE